MRTEEIVSRRWAAAVVASLLTALAALALTAWVALEPRYWLADAYAEPARGERGPRGIRGPAGPVGPEGPVGPGAVADFALVEEATTELSQRVDDLEATLEDVEAQLINLCDEIGSVYRLYANSATEDALRNLWLACL